MKIGVLFLTLAVSTNALHDGVQVYHYDPLKVDHPDGDPLVIDGWSVGATSSTGFRPNTQNHQPVIVRQNNGYIYHVSSEELNKLLNDPTFRIPGPRDDHVPYEEHYAERITGSHYTENGYGQHLGGTAHPQSYGSPHEQSYGGLPEQIFGAPVHQQQYPARPHSQRGASPHSQRGGASPQLPHGGAGFPGEVPGNTHASAQIPNRHITSESRSNSELSVGSRGSGRSQRSRASIGSQSSRHAGPIPNLHHPANANGGHGENPNIPGGSPHVQFARSGSLEHVIGSPHSQRSGASQASYRSGSGRPKSRLGPGGIPVGHPGSMPPGGPNPHQFAEHPNRHISSVSRSNSELSVGSRGSQGSAGSMGSQGSLGRHPAGNGHPPEFPGGYEYEGSQDGYDSAGSGRSHNSARSGMSHNSARNGMSHNSAEGSKIPTASGEKKSKKIAFSSILKKLKMGPSKKPSS